MTSEPLQVTLKVTTAFDQLGIPYLVGGSFASALYGAVRATMDADLVADIQKEKVPGLVAALESEFYIDADMILDAIAQSSSFNLIHLETMFKVDVFLLRQHPFDRNQMQRRISHVVGDKPEERAYFSTAEDIILAKLKWYQVGGETSERQWRDVLGVLNLQADRLDFRYIKIWAEKLGIQDLLQRALAEKNNP